MEKNLVVKEIHYYGFVVLLGMLLVFVLIPLGIQDGEPRLFPYIYSIGLIVVAGFKLLNIFLTKKGKIFKFGISVLKYVALSFFIYFVYSFLIQYVGFFAASALFILFFSRYLGESWKLSLILCIALPASIYVLFTRLLSLYFPEGIIF